MQVKYSRRGDRRISDDKKVQEIETKIRGILEASGGNMRESQLTLRLSAACHEWQTRAAVANMIHKSTVASKPLDGYSDRQIYLKSWTHTEEKFEFQEIVDEFAFFYPNN